MTTKRKKGGRCLAAKPLSILSCPSSTVLYSQVITTATFSQLNSWVVSSFGSLVHRVTKVHLGQMNEPFRATSPGLQPSVDSLDTVRLFYGSKMLTIATSFEGLRILCHSTFIPGHLSLVSHVPSTQASSVKAVTVELRPHSVSSSQTGGFLVDF